MSAHSADQRGTTTRTPGLLLAHPPLTPRKNLQGLPPTYLTHLRALLHQFLSQQLAPPDEGLPGPSNRAQIPDRPLWSPERLAEIEQAIWAVVLQDGGGGKEGLLGCDWEQWTAGARLRKAAWRRAKPALPSSAVPADEASTEAGGTVRGLALRLPVSGLLPSALSSATSTPTKGLRSPSIASSSRSRSPSGQTETGDVHEADRTPARHVPEAVDELEEWSRQIRNLKGFLPLTESVKEGWEVLDDHMPLRTPIREIPGAFPQAYSSHSSSEYFGRSLVSLSSSPRRTTSTDPLPPLLKPVICLSFVSAPPAYVSGSARSQSTLRFGRENSASEIGSSRHRHGSISGSTGGVAGGSGSGGLGGLGGWFGNKWSEMTASPEDGKVEIDFVAGRYALPARGGGHVRRRSSTIRKRRDSTTNDNDNNDSHDSNDGDSSGTDNDDTVDSHDSTWSGTEKGDAGGKVKDNSENVVIVGLGLDIPVTAAAAEEVGVVGGTIVIRGVKREEERRGLEKVFRAIIYTIQSHTFELSLLDAFSIPREPDPPPQLPPKPEGKRSRTTAEIDRPASPGLNRAASHGSGGRKGFFAKLGLGSSDGGKGVGRGMWDGLMGKRRASQIVHSPDEDPPIQPEEAGGGLFRRNSAVRDRSTSVAQSVETSPYHTTPMTHAHTHHIGGIDRHLHLLANIGAMLHSTTPGLVFPLPAILLRVYEEDRLRREKAGEEIKVENGGVAYASGTATPQPAYLTSTPGPRPRAGTISAWGAGSAVSNATSGSIASTGTGIDGLPLALTLSLPPRADDVRGRALGYRLGGDIRSGLASLAGNLEGWDGWCRLQRIEYVFWIGVEEKEGDERGVLACTKPLASVHRYYDPGTDVSIEDYLGELADELGMSGGAAEDREEAEVGPSTGEKDSDGTVTREEDDETHHHTSDESGSWEPVCGRPGCGVAERDHLRIWATGGRRVVGRVVKPRSGETGESNGGMRAQAECDTCGANSGWRDLGIVQGMSWNKLLELMLYSSILVSPTLCSHAATTAPSASASSPSVDFTYILSTPSLTLRLTPELQPVLDTRLPKLQVGPLVAKRKLGSEAAKAASDAFASAGDKNRNGALSQANKELLVREWRTGLETWMAKLEHTEATDSLIADLTAFADRQVNSASHDAVNQAGEPHPDLQSLQQRLEAWRMEHKPDMPKAEIVIPPLPDLEEQHKGMRLPGSSVLVRDDEPASVIAYTLSSLAYFNGLCGGSAKSTGAASTASTSSDTHSTAKGDEQWKIEVTRRDTPREILPLRALTKKRSEISLPSTARLPLSVTPNAPSLELNLQPVSGHSGARDGGSIDDLVKSISRAAGQDPVLTTSINPMLTPSVSLPRPSSAEPSPSTLAVPPSASNLSLPESDASTGEEKRHMTPRFRRRLADEAPPSSFRRTVSASVSANTSPRSTPTPTVGSDTPPRSSRDKENLSIHPSPGLSATSSLAGHDRQISVDKDGWGGSVTSSFASSFNTLLKLGTDVTDSLASRVRAGTGEPSRSLASIMNPLNLHAADTNPDDSRPHIHVDLSSPTYKIGCTVYFASAFDTLRRRCAFDRSFVRSLERSVGWLAEGGKSKANFWKTEDGRLVVKSLVTKWNVSDLQALLEIAPAYFEHMATTHNKATALAKIVGFYTVKMHDVQTNEKRTMDLLVMENLFWKQEIDRTFDLKGIEGRRVPKGKDGSTMFDAEWLEGQATSPLFVHPHAKRILLDSLTTDTRFLSNQHIVDYSLLLGLDRAHSELVVGVVDAVGSYGLFKNIESMGKIALNRGREGEVTIIPPDQYRERFETALRGYFTACPDKWSRSAKRAGTCNRIEHNDLPLTLSSMQMQNASDIIAMSMQDLQAPAQSMPAELIGRTLDLEPALSLLPLIAGRIMGLLWLATLVTTTPFERYP